MSVIQQPGISNPEDKIVWSENLGALLLFFPTSFVEKVKTTNGEADAVYARIVRLNDGRVFENAMVYPTALVTQLKGAIPDGIVLGTLAQGENKKGNPPWLLQPHDAQQVAQAEAWMAANPRVQQAPQPQAPAAPQWGGAAAAPAPAWGQQAPAAAPAAGGWGNPPAPQPSAPNWGSTPAAPAAPAPAPSSPGAGWGSPAPEGVPGTAPAAWQNAGAPAAAPVAPQSDPSAVAARLTAMGITIPPGTTLEALMGLAAVYGIQ